MHIILILFALIGAGVKLYKSHIKEGLESVEFSSVSGVRKILAKIMVVVGMIAYYAAYLIGAWWLAFGSSSSGANVPVLAIVMGGIVWVVLPEFGLFEKTTKVLLKAFGG